MPTKTKRHRERIRFAHGLIQYAVPRSGTQEAVADAFNVSRTRLAHYVTDERDNPLSKLIVAVMALAESDETTARQFAEAITRAVMMTELFNASTEKLVERARYLRAHVNVLGGHEIEIGQTYFLGQSTGDDYATAHRDEGHAQFELADIRDVLWIRDNIELRDALAAGGAS